MLSRSPRAQYFWMARIVRACPAASYRAAASSTVSVYARSSSFASGRGCSSMFVGYHRLVAPLVGYPHMREGTPLLEGWEFCELPIGERLDAFQLGDQHVRVADDVGRQISRESVEDLGRH